MWFTSANFPGQTVTCFTGLIPSSCGWEAQDPTGGEQDEGFRHQIALISAAGWSGPTGRSWAFSQAGADDSATHTPTCFIFAL